MSQVSLELDQRTEEAIEQLKRTFGVKSRSGAIRKAIALARIASETSDHNVVTFLDKDGEKRSIILEG